ncbi:MAG: hypothetical protein C4523_16190 [Myxococcales bacterium]|nr:MAG: hypothetical protein C4523_16190 [Myxococcales bacterium]
MGLAGFAALGLWLTLFVSEASGQDPSDELPSPSGDPAAAAPLPWKEGDRLAEQWTIVRIARHPEFLRLTLRSGEAETGLEIGVNDRGEGEWNTRHYRLSPAPGQEPPPPLLSAMMEELRRVDSGVLHVPFVRSLQGDANSRAQATGPLGLPLPGPWTLAAAALLALYGAFRLSPWRGPLKRAERFGGRVLDAALVVPTRLLLALFEVFPPSDLSGDERPRRRSALLAALLVVVAGFVLTMRTTDMSPLHYDSAKDLLIARDCLEHPDCPRKGPMSSFGGYVQGGLWIYAIAAAQGTGLGTGGLLVAIVALIACAGGVVAYVGARRTNALAGFVAGGLWIALALRFSHFPWLWNPSLAPLPIALFYAALLYYLHRRQATRAALTGAGLALAVDAHLVNIMLAVPAAVACGTADRRWRHLAVFGVGTLAAMAILSSASLAANVRVVIASDLAAPALIGLAACLAVGGTLGRLAKRGPRMAREIAIVMASTLALFAALFAAGALFGRTVRGHYWLPLLPGAALFAGSLVGFAAEWRPFFNSRWTRLLARGLAVAAVCFLGWNGVLWRYFAAADESPRRSWALVDVPVAAELLYGRHYRYADLRYRLQGTDSYLLMVALGAYDPSPPAVAGPPASDMQLLKIDKRSTEGVAAPEGMAVLPLPDDKALLARPVASWLDRRRLSVCYELLDAPAAPPQCASVAMEDRTPLVDRSYMRRYEESNNTPVMALRDKVLGAATGRVRMSFIIPLAAREPFGRRVVRLLEAPDHRGADEWRIAQVSGLAANGPLPSDRMTLDAGEAREGEIRFAIEGGVEEIRNEYVYPPSFVEYSEAEAAFYDRILSAAP